jgi:hypothetical protein
VVSIDWQQLLGWVLVGGSGLGGVVWGILKATTGLKSGWRTLTPVPTANVRSADALPPDGSVLWVEDLCQAMGDASAESKLAVILSGSTRDGARAARIRELEEAS